MERATQDRKNTVGQETEMPVVGRKCSADYRVDNHLLGNEVAGEGGSVKIFHAMG